VEKPIKSMFLDKCTFRKRAFGHIIDSGNVEKHENKCTFAFIQSENRPNSTLNQNQKVHLLPEQWLRSGSTMIRTILTILTILTTSKFKFGR
jgi:hypothetical protein